MRLSNQQRQSVDQLVHSAFLNSKSNPPSQADQVWMDVATNLRAELPSPALFRYAWERCYENWDSNRNGPAPIWVPDPVTVAESNLGRWMTELELANDADFHRWTIERRPEFWQQAVGKLQIQFRHRTDQIVDLSQGPRQPHWFPQAKLNIVESCLQAADDQAAIVYQANGGSLETMTYDQLSRLCNQVSNSLRQRGLQPGDAVAVVLPMTALSIPIYLGIIQTGCVVVSIADSFAAPEITTRLEISSAKLVVTYDHVIRSGKALPLYQRVAQASSIPTIVLAADGQSSVELRQQDLAWDQFLVGDDQFEPYVADGDDPINILFSSGTTGQPKAIPWNKLTPIKCAIDGYCHQDIRPGDVCVWPTNLGWMMGPWLIFAALINRATIGIYEDAPLGRDFGQFIETARVNMLGVVPTLVKAWRKDAQMEGLDWSSIRLFSSTGEASQADDMFYLSALAGIKPIIEYCGGTEIAGGYITSVVTHANAAACFNSPAVGLDFCLLNEENQIAEAGEVFLIPPSIGLSQRLIKRDHDQAYYSDLPELADGRPLRRHGDHIRKLPGGYWQAGGRVDDTMNLGGIKISSAEIERVLNQIDEVVETAAVAFAEQGGPEQLIVFAVLNLQKQITSVAEGGTGQSETDQISAEQVAGEQVAGDKILASMNRQIRKELNPLFKVSRIHVVPCLPRTASGKVMRRELRSSLQQLK